MECRDTFLLRPAIADETALRYDGDRELIMESSRVKSFGFCKNCVQVVLLFLLLSNLGGAQAGQIEPLPDAIIISVRDNSAQSALSAVKILDVVSNPERDPELHAWLGSPSSVRRTMDLRAGSDQCATTPTYFPRRIFKYAEIEGYILKSCPPGFTCSNLNDPTQPQRLYRVYNPVDKISALLLESQLSLPAFAGYVNPEPGLSLVPIGFVFPNVDSDGDSLPDGFERLYGLNPANNDSDCDSLNAGIEYPIAGIQAVGDDPLSGGICP